MLVFLFLILFIAVLGNLIRLSFRMAWKLSRIILTLVLFPIALVVMAVIGLLPLVILILIAVGIFSLLSPSP